MLDQYKTPIERATAGQFVLTALWPTGDTTYQLTVTMDVRAVAVPGGLKQATDALLAESRRSMRDHPLDLGRRDPAEDANEDEIVEFLDESMKRSAENPDG